MTSTAGEGHPDQIGPYKILRLLGEGGMGLVYEAEQRVKLKRRVAVKVLDAGATDEGRPYFVMERVDGEALKEYADTQKLSVEDRVIIERLP